MEDGSLLRCGSGPDSSHHHHVRVRTLTGQSLGWAGWDIVSASVTIWDEVPNVSTAALYFKSLWVIFLVITHIRVSQINIIPSKVPLCYHRYLSSWSKFIFLFLWGFFVLFFEWKFLQKILDKWDQCKIWPLTLPGLLLQFQFPFFWGSIMKTYQTIFLNMVFQLTYHVSSYFWFYQIILSTERFLYNGKVY